ncbi:Replication protein A 70 kDa DNA-binding subunit A [Rhynchospora pubera]|uniref:Replication protein A 70 kDa DNA-binding subunit A n=1 Tax=Rhynchospora pubera TaxID=906938 RepID=A0AAV8HZN4_9POAL|nr:Replication protein A 70 kDa DNA-binding subunit A [Rhynchospora pubera]
MATPLPMIETTNSPVPVLALTPTTDTENVKIHGRPVRIWQAADARFGRVYNMAFLFIDHTGGKIQGLIPVPEYQRQSAVFREDNLCEITRFTLEGSTIDYQVVKHPHILSLTRETVVTVLQPGLYDIPRTHFDFISFREIGVSITHLKAVMDVIGRIVGFSDVVLTTGSQPSRVRGMYLADNEGRTVELALWGNYADQFDVLELFEQSKQCPIIIAINNAQIKYWRAQTYNIHVVAPHRADPIKVTMAQLMGLYLDNYNENYYQCAGVIMSINNRFDWYYESCPDCRRKLNRKGGLLWCDHCNTRRANSIPWYKIRVQAVDHTGDAQFVLFGNLGEQAVGMPAQAIVALQQQDRKKTPAPLMDIIGKKFLFTFAGKQRVPYQQNRIYTVVELAPVPPELLELLPQPILHIEAAPVFASESSMQSTEGKPHTPPHQSIAAAAASANPQIGHSNAKQSSTDTRTEHHGGAADPRGKRPLLNEEDTPEQPTNTVRRKLDFDQPPAETLQTLTGRAPAQQQDKP